jgi:hypothetical protein
MPIKAAERRQMLAPGDCPGFFVPHDEEPGRGDRFLANLPPLTGLRPKPNPYHGLRPWLRSVAAPRLNKDAAFAAIKLRTC